MTYTSDGTLVSTYGSNPAFDLSDFSPTAYLIAGDGDLLVGGNTVSTNVPEVVAFTGDDLDTSFGTDGITTLRIFPTALDNADHSQIWVSGTDGSTSTNYLARLNSDGSIDTTFGLDGYAAGTVSSDDVTVDSNGLQRLYAEYNADYSITSLTDSSGAVVERYRYDPYGNVTVMNPDGTTLGDGTPASSNYNWIYLDQGMRFSVSTGTYATETRVYSPSLGRPLQEDPLGAAYPDGPNDSQWEESNPVGNVDPSGMGAVSAFLGGVASNAGGAVAAWMFGAPVPPPPAAVSVGVAMVRMPSVSLASVAASAVSSLPSTSQVQAALSNVAFQTVGFVAGAGEAITQDNSFGLYKPQRGTPPASVAYGRMAGHVITIIQAAVEIQMGLTAIGGGVGGELFTVGLSTPVSAVAVVGGSAVTLHGGYLIVNALKNAAAAPPPYSSSSGAVTCPDSPTPKPEITAPDVNAPKSPGAPGAGDGYVAPKRGLGANGETVKNPNGSGRGWVDKYGNVWVPTGDGPLAHGGPHWDVQKPDGSHINIYPGGKAR